jgi:hypothetical protein
MDNTTRMQQTDDAWNGRDWDAFDRLHDPECIVFWPGREREPTRGGHDHRAEAVAFCDAFPDNRVENDPYDGRIVEEYLFYDNGTFVEQIGLA